MLIGMIMSGTGILFVLFATFAEFNAGRPRLQFEPPACYVCGHPGPMGELVPKLPCCALCREIVMREADAAIQRYP